jgi:hypothetical protein
VKNFPEDVWSLPGVMIIIELELDKKKRAASWLQQQVNVAFLGSRVGVRTFEIPHQTYIISFQSRRVTTPTIYKLLDCRRR